MRSKRDAYFEKMKAKLDELNAEIAKVEAKSRLAEADAQAKYKEQMDAIQRQRRSAEKKLDDIRQAGGDAWEDLKAGLELVTDSLGEALRSAQSRFR